MVSMTDSFDVPQAVRNAAKRGLELRRKYGRGGLDAQQANREGVGSGVQRASDLMSGKVSYRTVKRMAAFFSRHRKNKDSRTDNGEPGAGMIAWAIWGGDAGDRWSRSVIERVENIKKGTLLHLLVFGAVPADATDSTSEEATDSTPDNTVKSLTFSQLLSMSLPDSVIPQLTMDNLVQVEEDYEYEGPVVPMEPPVGSIPPLEEPLSEQALTRLADAETDEEAESIALEKAVVDINLMEDYIQPQDPPSKNKEDEPTDPAEPVEPPSLQVVVYSADHSRLKKAVKTVLGMKNLEPASLQIGKHIMRGEWDKIDMSLVCSYLMTDDYNAQAVGGEVMLDLLSKASVPKKYLEGLSGEERAKRKKFIENRIKGKHRGDKYKDFPSDKGAKTKPSKYSRTSFAARVREEMKGSSKGEFLSAAAKVSGISRAILEQVYKRGSEAWATGGHRVGASQEAWARARVYSFCTGGTTRRTADKDLWQRHKA